MRDVNGFAYIRKSAGRPETNRNFISPPVLTDYSESEEAPDVFGQRARNSANVRRHNTRVSGRAFYRFPTFPPLSVLSREFIPKTSVE